MKFDKEIVNENICKNCKTGMKLIGTVFNTDTKVFRCEGCKMEYDVNNGNQTFNRRVKE